MSTMVWFSTIKYSIAKYRIVLYRIVLYSTMHEIEIDKPYRAIAITTNCICINVQLNLFAVLRNQLPVCIQIIS